MNGILKGFNSDKGYGFIDVEGQEDDVFFHVNNIDKKFNPQNGDLLEFDTENTDRGPSATNVNLVEQ